MEIGKDLLTGEAFYKKRNNQRFANRKNQIDYNNKIANDKRQSKASIDKLLNKNRSILKAVLGDAREVIKSKDFLLGAGFYFTVLTHNRKVGEQIYHCIYDYAYFVTEGNNYKIISNGPSN